MGSSFTYTFSRWISAAGSSYSLYITFHNRFFLASQSRFKFERSTLVLIEFMSHVHVHDRLRIQYGRTAGDQNSQLRPPTRPPGPRSRSPPVPRYIVTCWMKTVSQ